MSIEQVIRAYETALSANDTPTILDLYSAEPLFMPQGVLALVGREDGASRIHRDLFATHLARG